MKVAIASRTLEAAQVISQLLSPWRVTFTGSDEADVLVVYGEKSTENMKTIVIPSGSIDFKERLKDWRLNVSRKLGARIFVAATPQTVLSMVPETQFQYDGPTGNISSVKPSPINLDDNTLVLSLDIIEEYERIVTETLNPKSSMLYRLLTGLPIPYTVAPKRFRNFFMRRKRQQISLNLHDKLPLDALRFLLARAIEEIAHEKLIKKTWNGKHYACAVTHDIETYHGLKKAKAIKRLEEKYDVPSAWYIPSKRFLLEREIVEKLANFGEVGAHDTKHDGKLDKLSKQELLKRFSEAKQTIEELAACRVLGFRTPLLQQDSTILSVLREAGYSYDTSVPAWEPKHPQTMGPYGLGTTYPMFLDGVTEIPISLVQDHQLLYTLGLEPKEVIAEWLSTMAIVKELGGCCVLLSHPEYKLFDMEAFVIYEELLNAITADKQVWLATPKQLADGAGK